MEFLKLQYSTLCLGMEESSNNHITGLVVHLIHFDFIWMRASALANRV